MAIVPKLERKVQAQAFSGQQSIQTNADMFTGPLGSKTTTQALSKVDNFIEKQESVFLKAQRDSDERTLLEVEAGLDEYEQALFNNEQNGIYNRKLGNAQNVTGESQDSFDGQAATLLKRYEQNPRIQNKLQAHLQARRKRIATNASRWEQDQTTKHTEQLLTGKADRAMETAIDSYNPEDMTHFNQAATEMVNTINRLGKDRGEDQEVIEQRVYDATSKVHIGVIDRMMKNDQDIAAQDYLEEHGKAIAIDERIKLEGQVKEKAYTKQAQNDAASYLAKADGDYAKAIKLLREDKEGQREEIGVKQLKALRAEANDADLGTAQSFVGKLTGTYAENIDKIVNSNLSAKVKELARGELRARRADEEAGNEDAAREIADQIKSEYPDDPKKQEMKLGLYVRDQPDLYKKTLAILDAKQAREKKQETERVRESLKASNDLIEKGGSYDDLTALQKSDVRQVLGREEKYRQREIEVANGIPSVTLPGLNGTLQNLYMDDKVAFANLDLYSDKAYVGKLSNNDLEKWANLQRGLNKANQKDAAKSQLVDKILKGSKSILSAANIRKDGKSSATIKRYNSITEDVARAVEGLPQDKVLSPQEQRDLVRALLLEGEEVTGSFFYDDDMPAYEADENFFILDSVDDGDNAKALDDFAERANITGRTAREDTAKIVQVLIRARTPVTIENIRLIYEKATGK